MRAWATVIQRDLQVAGGDRRHVRRPAGRLHDVPGLRRGRPPLRHRAARHAVDAAPRSTARSAASPRRAADAPRPYRLVVLSDHGQSQGATFLDRYGITLEELVRDAARRRRASQRRPSTDEALGYLGAALTEAAGGDVGAGARRARRDRARRTVDGAVQLGEDASERRAATATSCPSSSVMASGCLGPDLVPARARPRHARAPRGALPAASSRPCATIPGSASCSCAPRSTGAVVLGAARHALPRRGRASRARTRWRRSAPTPRATSSAPTASPHCPDIVVNSTYWDDLDEVAAFEELVGSHGGMGGAAVVSRSSCIPSELAMPDEELRRRRGHAPRVPPLARAARPPRVRARSSVPGHDPPARRRLRDLERHLRHPARPRAGR